MKGCSEDIEAIEELVQVFRIERDNLTDRRCRLGKAILLEALEPQAESIPVPPEDLDAILTAVREHEQRLAQWVERHGRLHEDREAIDLLAKVHRRAVKIDLGVRSEAEHQRVAAARSTAATSSNETVTSRPVGSLISSRASETVAGCWTRTKADLD